MMHPQMVTRLAEMHQAELRQDEAAERIGDTARAGRAGLQERLSVGVGAALIAAGQRLQAPYEPAFNHQSEASRSGC
jgi:hypothetical protein